MKGMRVARSHGLQRAPHLGAAGAPAGVAAGWVLGTLASSSIAVGSSPTAASGRIYRSAVASYAKPSASSTWHAYAVATRRHAPLWRWEKGGTPGACRRGTCRWGSRRGKEGMGPLTPSSAGPPATPSTFACSARGLRRRNFGSVGCARMLPTTFAKMARHSMRTASQLTWVRTRCHIQQI